MSRMLSHPMTHVTLLLGVAAVLTLPNLGGPSLWDIDEGNNSTCAAEMMASGNWVVPTFNYSLRVDKPALLYWLQIFGYQIFGIGEFAARLPSALAAILTVLLVYGLGRSLFGAATALLGGLILASSAFFCASGHFANPDALLHLCTVAYFWSFWEALRRHNPRWLILGGVAIGFGILAKGPVAAALPLTVLSLFLLWTRRWDLLWNKPVLWGFLVAFLVAGPWYIWVGIETKAEFLRGFFLRHNVGRFQAPMEGHGGGLWYYPVVFLLGLAPWSAFLGPALWSTREDRGQGDHNGATGKDATRFLWCWLAVYLVFFSLSGTKLPNYVLPAYAPLALFLGRYLERWRQGDPTLVAWTWPAGLIGFAFVGLVLALGLSLVSGTIPVGWLRGARIPELQLWALVGVIPLIAALGAGMSRRRTVSLGFLASGAVALLTPLAAVGIMTVDQQKAPRMLLAAVQAEQDSPEIRLASFRYFQPSLVFYARRQVVQLEGEEQVLELLRYPVEVYLFLPEEEWERLKERASATCRALASRYDLYRKCQVVVVTNR